MGDPQATRRALEEFKQRARGVPRRARLDAAAAEVLDAFDAAGIDSIVLKGPALARTLYRPDEHRGYSDIDLLVAPQGLARARDVLVELGYRHATETLGIDDVATIQHAEMWYRAHGESDGASQIDLHWQLAGCEAATQTTWQALAARRTSIDFSGRRASVLDQAGLAFHLATHAAQHGPEDVKAMADLVRGVERWAADIWVSAAQLARQTEGVAAFAAGLRLTPNGSRLALELGLPSTDVLSWAIAHREARPRGTFHLQALVGAHGARERVNVLRRSLFPNREWIAWQYPWASTGGIRLVVAYAAHLLRAPVWAARAWEYRRRERRAAG